MKLFCRALLGALSSALVVTLAGCGVGVSTSAAPVVVTRSFQMTAGASASNEAVQTLAFYPNSLTINAGDTVTWTYPTGEPHTVTFLGPRAALPPPTDPTTQQPAGGSTYDGSVYTSSGFVLLGKTFSLTFPKPGTYSYFCLIHGTMQGTIVVQPAGSPLPATQQVISSAAASQIAADLALGPTAVAAFPYPVGGTHLAAGIAPGLNTGPPSTTTVLRFLDGAALDQTSVTIPLGASLTWTNLSNNEPHTITFAPVGQPFPTLNPFGPASGGSAYDGTQLVNSGVVLPGMSYTLQFTARGTYTYHCIFHDDTEHMLGTVVVQ